MAVWNVVNLSFVNSKKRIDADFYKKEYVALDSFVDCGLRIDQISRTVDLQSNGAFKVIFNILNDGNHKTIPYIRSGNVGDYFVNKDYLHFISEEAHSKLTKTITQYDDILMARKGKIGGATIILEDDVNFNSNDNVVNVRLFDTRFNPKYFVAFWNSKYGLKQVERLATGNVQPWLSMKQVRELKTVLLDESKQLLVAELVENSYSLLNQSKTLYKEAEKLLEKELGLDGLEFEKPRSYTAKLSEVYSHNRFDSEHFKPKYFQLKELIKNYTYGYESLTSHVNYLKPNINPHSNPNQDYNYIELSGINASLGIVENSEKLKGRETPSRAKRVVQSCDLLVSSVVGSVEKVALVSDDEDGFLASTGFFHFQSDFYTPEYLLILMKSKIIKEQLFQESTGGILSAVSDSNLKNIIIPIVDETIRNEIALKVKKSHKALKQSKQLLEDAKAKVEALIEEASR